MQSGRGSAGNAFAWHHLSVSHGGPFGPPSHDENSEEVWVLTTSALSLTKLRQLLEGEAYIKLNTGYVL